MILKFFLRFATGLHFVCRTFAARNDKTKRLWHTNITIADIAVSMSTNIIMNISIIMSISTSIIMNTRRVA